MIDSSEQSLVAIDNDGLLVRTARKMRLGNGGPISQQKIPSHRGCLLYDIPLHLQLIYSEIPLQVERVDAARPSAGFAPPPRTRSGGFLLTRSSIGTSLAMATPHSAALSLDLLC